MTCQTSRTLCSERCASALWLYWPWCGHYHGSMLAFRDWLKAIQQQPSVCRQCQLEYNYRTRVMSIVDG